MGRRLRAYHGQCGSNSRRPDGAITSGFVLADDSLTIRWNPRRAIENVRQVCSSESITTHRSQVSTMLDAEPKLSSIRF